MKRIIQIITIVCCCLTYSMAKAQYTTTYEYDSLNRLVKVDYPSGQRVEFAYDVLGNRTGMTVTQVYIAQSIELFEGWNWWAPTVERETLLSLMETTLGTKGIRIDSQDSGSAQQNDGSWSGDLQSITPGQMYRIQTNTACTLSLLGVSINSATVTLNLGENWFGFVGSEKTVVEAFANLPPAEGDKVISQDEGFAIFNGTEWEGTLATLVPGKGYVYVSNAAEPKTLVIGE